MNRDRLAIALVLIGFLQMVGFVSGQDWLRGLGVLTLASPLPIVFTQVKGVETFASDFYLRYTDQNGQQQTIKLTPELYAQFKAPYNYRNVVGAAVSYGPILPQPIWQSVLQYTFIDPGELSQSLGLETPLLDAAIIVKTRTAGRSDEWTLSLGESH